MNRHTKVLIIHSQPIQIMLASLRIMFLTVTVQAASPLVQLADQQGVPTRGIVVLDSLKHDPSRFTQGLLVHDGWIYEGTGMYGQSALYRQSLNDRVDAYELPLASTLFGEGIAILDEQLLQLTWKSRIALRYQLSDLTPLANFTYDTEGWGLTTDGTNWIRSDGSPTITFHEPEQFAPIHQIEVRMGQRPIYGLNELEWQDGTILANVYQFDVLVRIDPGSGEVLEVIDATELGQRCRTPRRNVLNGIALLNDGTLLLTGKNWPWIYRVRLQ